VNHHHPILSRPIILSLLLLIPIISFAADEDAKDIDVALEEVVTGIKEGLERSRQEEDGVGHLVVRDESCGLFEVIVFAGHDARLVDGLTHTRMLMDQKAALQALEEFGERLEGLIEGVDE